MTTAKPRSFQPAQTAQFSTVVDKVDSSGRRNTSIVEVLMGRPAGWMKELTGRSPMESPGKPSLRREVERGFWREVAKGVTSEEAAAAVGVSPAKSGLSLVPPRWWYAYC